MGLKKFDGSAFDIISNWDQILKGSKPFNIEQYVFTS